MRNVPLLPLFLMAMAALPAKAAPPAGPLPARDRPSETMRRLAAPVVPPGYAASFVFSIALEDGSEDQILVCKNILARQGYLPAMSARSSSPLPSPLWSLSGSKEYGQPDATADAVLAEVAEAQCAAKLTWTVAQKIAPAAR